MSAENRDAILANMQEQVQKTLIKYSALGLTEKAYYHSYDLFYKQIIPWKILFRKIHIYILEIGVGRGGSIKCWDEIFGYCASIYGIDNDLSKVDEDVRKNPRIHLRQYNQNDPAIATAFKDIKFDLIIDDASHRMEDQIASFNILKPLLRKNGQYVIESIYPDYTYPEEFRSQFEEVDYRHVKGRGDDRIFVHPKMYVYHGPSH